VDDPVIINCTVDKPNVDCDDMKIYPPVWAYLNADRMSPRPYFDQSALFQVGNPGSR